MFWHFFKILFAFLLLNPGKFNSEQHRVTNANNAYNKYLAL